MARTAGQDDVRELQRTLYRAAKADPGRRFHAPHGKVVRSDVLDRAWGQVRRNRGAAGIDQATIADVEQYGPGRLLDELAADLRDGSYRPLAARRSSLRSPAATSSDRCRYPRSATGSCRPLRGSCSSRSLRRALRRARLGSGLGARRTTPLVLVDEAWKGRRWVVETDIASCFEAIPHDRLMQAIETRVCDRHLLKLLRAVLRAGVMQGGAVRRSTAGTPQGGVISPLLANVYLDRLDRAWQARGEGVLVRYADDLVVMCRTEREAERALGALRSMLAELGLEPKEAKTRIVHLREGGEGIDFLGFEHRWVRGRESRHRHLAFLVRWPSRQAMQHARDRLRQLTRRDRLLLGVEHGTQEINLSFCAAGRATSATETRPASSTRSSVTRSIGSPASWPSATRRQPHGAAGDCGRPNAPG
jgi:RNA-directed DNA polymerase